jgi:uncharacterized membrane protein YdjX (TVP38/TMEM64 family)
MGRWIAFAVVLALTLLVMFGVASVTGLGIEDPTPLLHGAAIAGVLLLIADVVLPIPSSLVMAAHGALFGVVPGALLSIVGSTAAALTGFALGRAGNDVLRRFVTPAEHDRAGAMLRRWGVLAIVLSRPVPILAETVAILAGSSPLTWRQVTLAAAAGSLAPSIVYAWAGAHANGAASHAAIFCGVLAITGMLWYVGRASSPRAGEAG